MIRIALCHAAEELGSRTSKRDSLPFMVRRLECTLTMKNSVLQWWFNYPRWLAELEKSLDPDRFLRVHRSYLLNLDRIDRIELYAKDSRVAILRDGTRIPVSRSGYSRFRERL